MTQLEKLSFDTDEPLNRETLLREFSIGMPEYSLGFIAGFRAARTMILNLEDRGGDSLHSTWMKRKIEYVGEEWVNE